MPQATTAKNIYLFESDKHTGASVAAKRMAAEFITWEETGPRHNPAIHQLPTTPTYVVYNGMPTTMYILPELESIAAPLVVEVFPLNSIGKKSDPYKHHGVYTLLDYLAEALERSSWPYVIVLGLNSEEYKDHIHSAYRIEDLHDIVSGDITYSFHCTYRAEDNLEPTLTN